LIRTTPWRDAKTRSQTGAQAQHLAPPQGPLDKLVAEAIVDCYNESEQVTGLYTMIADNLALPFETTVLGVAVTDHRGRRRLSKLTTRSPFNA
jgi:hypothetical protein